MPHATASIPPAYRNPPGRLCLASVARPATFPNYFQPHPPAGVSPPVTASHPRSSTVGFQPSMSVRALLIAYLGIGVGFPNAGCETNTGRGALIGGGAGAAIGAGVGSLSHARAGEGALIGGAIGAIGGALVGNEMDKAERREERRARYD